MRLLAICVLISIGQLAGCGRTDAGPERASVQGRITLGGEPLSTGQVSLIPEGGAGPTSGVAIVDGEYTIPPEKGPVLLKHRVEITSFQKTGKKLPAGPPSPPGTMVDEIKQVVPEKYNVRSVLTATISAGKNEIDFDLEKE